LEAGWDWFTGTDLTLDEQNNLACEGWKLWALAWCLEEDVKKEIWIRPTPAPEVPELVEDEGWPDD
jgi:hypothetical protein